MNLRRILCAATTVVLCLSADVLVHAQPMGRESTVSGTGVEIIKRTPETLRMQIEISAKAKTLGVALKKIEAHRDAALNQLAKMSSEKETTRAGEVRISAPNPQQQQMEMMVRQRMRQAGKKNKKAPEKPIAVSCTVTAEWKLKGKTPIELLLEAQAIEDKVRGADLAGGDAEEKTAEEQELAEEMQEQMPNFNDDDSQPKPGEPTFIFVSKISPEDRTKATAAAFAKARQQAEELSVAAGAELGALLGLSRQVTPNNLGFGMSPYYAYGNMRNQRLMQVMLERAESGDDDGAEAIGAQPSEVALPINVTAAFQLKAAK